MDHPITGAFLPEGTKVCTSCQKEIKPGTEIVIGTDFACNDKCKDWVLFLQGMPK